MTDKNKKPINKDKLLGILLLVLEFSFMLTVFAPLNFYYPSRTEFWFKPMQMIPLLLITFAALFAVIALLFLVISKLEGLTRVMYTLLISGTLFFYVQGNYIPRDYGLMNGTNIDFGSFKGYAAASKILFFVCIAIGAFIFIKFKKFTYSIGRYLALFLLVIQLVTIATLVIKNQVEDPTLGDAKGITKQDMMNFSKDENILIFVLDAMDASYMKEALAEDRTGECHEVLKDFTFYPDAVGSYPSTRAAMIQIFTGAWDDNSVSFKDYVKNAYATTDIYTKLQKNGYKVNLYSESEERFTSEFDICSNIYYSYEYSINDYKDFEEYIYKMVAFEYMPHQLKHLFVIRHDAFNTLKHFDDGDYPPFRWNCMDFYSYIKENEFDNSCKNKTFKIYHIAGAHPEYTFDENLVENPDAGYGYMDETYGNIRILKEYFEKMKESGLYDNTAIILMADHGFGTSSADFNQNPLFMVKNINETHSDVMMSDAKMSWEYLKDVYGRLSEEQPVDEEFINSLYTGRRRFLHYRWQENGWDLTYLPPLTEYYCEGEASKRADFVASGYVQFSPDTDMSVYAYQPSTVLSVADGSLFSHVVSGYDPDCYTSDNLATFYFDLSDAEYGDVKADISLFKVIDQKQSVSIYANGNKVFEKDVTGPEVLEFDIPKEYFNDNKLMLSLNLPDAKKQGETDIRPLGLGIESIVLK